MAKFQPRVQDEGRDDGLVARFDSPQWAPTPGQYLVLYEGETCLGGGVITDASEGAAVDSAMHASATA